MLELELKNLAESLGADFFGIADLTPAHDGIVAQGGEDLGRYPAAISAGVALVREVVELIPRGRERAAAVSYRHLYDTTNQLLDTIALRLAKTIERAGHAALPVPASRRADDERICAIFSHKLAARLAGLGWIGRSCLLITPTMGPRVRWVSVLTDAPLPAVAAPLPVRCGECRRCVEICPPQAFTGEPFRADEPREARYDARRCDAYIKSLKRDDTPGVCGMCVWVCPFGRRGK